jgi:hypothetical protein
VDCNHPHEKPVGFSLYLTHLSINQQIPKWLFQGRFGSKALYLMVKSPVFDGQKPLFDGQKPLYLMVKSPCI